MSVHTEYSFSWITVGVLVLTTILWIALKRIIRFHYPSIYSELAYSGTIKLPYWVTDQNLIKWLFALNYLDLKNKGLILLCIIVKLLWAASIYFVITEPIYFESVTAP